MSVDAQQRPYRLVIAIPASLVADIPHLREKTARIGLIGRAAAIFRVNEITIYMDKPKEKQASDSSLIAQILTYIETPPYLRKYLIKIKPELRYAGTLPPLLSPHHPRSRSAKELKRGDLREGFVLTASDSKSTVDIGVEKPITVYASIPMKTRVTIRITEIGTRIVGEAVETSRIQIYWGYRVTEANLPLGRLLKAGDFDLTIGTSRYGILLASVVDEIREKLSRTQSTLVAFGSPRRGLREILAEEALRAESEFDYVLNTVPDQAVETVRTEEAVIASLAVINELGGSP